MRKIRCCIASQVLALACSTAVLAGDIQGPTGCSSPSPVAGDIQTPTTGYSSPSPMTGETQGPGIAEPAPSLSAAGQILMPTARGAEDLSIGEMLLLKVLLTIF